MNDETPTHKLLDVTRQPLLSAAGDFIEKLLTRGPSYWARYPTTQTAVRETLRKLLSNPAYAIAGYELDAHDTAAPMVTITLRKVDDAFVAFGDLPCDVTYRGCYEPQIEVDVEV